MEYRGYKIDVQPGMCCPEVRIRLNGKTVHSFPCNDPHTEGMRRAQRYIDAMFEEPTP